MPRKKVNSGGATPPGPKPADRRAGPRELVLQVRPEAALRASPTGLLSESGADVRALGRLLKQSGATLRPLYGPSEERVRRMAERAGARFAASMPLFYRVLAPEAALAPLAPRLARLPFVAGAWLKPGPEPAAMPDSSLASAGEPPAEGSVPALTPDFSPRQGYLDPAPGGLNARYAWKRAGGLGAGVKIIDIEGAWRFSHEDLSENQGGLVAGEPLDDEYWRSHGTAVLGEFSGDDNAIGTRGFCPHATARAVSIVGLGTALAIRTGADLLDPGDLLLIELHRPGPRFDFAPRLDLRGYIPVEWWPDDFLAIQYATALGVVVVAVGGNGAEDLDDPLYDTPAAGFPAEWQNPFRREADSGSVLIGAGAPPPGTHDHSFGPDRSRLGFSNHGSCFDAQGWGHEITTTGYGDLQGGPDEDLWYTDRFSGTSGAGGMVVGALGCVQGALRAAERAPLTPAEARAVLRAGGTPQQDAPDRPATQRIGSRPDLRQIFVSLRLAKVRPGELPEGGPRPVPDPWRVDL